MLCPNCGSDNRDGAKYCDECGFPLTGAIARAAQEATAAGVGAVAEGQAEELELAEEAAEQAEDADGSESGIDFELAAVETASEQDEEPDGAEPATETEPVAVEEAAISGKHAALPIEELQAEDADDADLEGQLEVTAVLPIDDLADAGDAGKPAQDAGEAGGFPEEVDDSTEVIEEDQPEQPAADGAFGVDPFEPSSDYDMVADDITQIIGDLPTTYSNGADIDLTQRIDGGWAPDTTMQMPRVEGEQEQSRDYIASSTKEQKKTYRAVINLVIIVAVLAVIAGIASYVMGLWGGKVVPDVAGMTESDARITLENNGFTVKPLQVKSDDTEGLVLLMDPAGGSRVPEGAEVAIHIATARLIPDIVGKSQDEAEAMLAEAGYDNVTATFEKSDGDEGLVLSVDPAVGERAKSTTPVTIAVSEAYRVPEVSGMGAYEAYDAIEAAGLTPSFVYVDSSEYIDGTFLGVYPEPGTKMNAGDYVSISITRSRGAQLEALTQSLLSPGNTITYGGYSYTVESTGYVSYVGNDTVAFSATARPTFSLFGETLFESPAQTIAGSVVWSPENQVVSII